MTVLKILRKSMRLSQEELAEKLGSHIKRIRRCESLNPNQNRELELTVAEWQRFSRLVWDELKLDLPFVPEIRLSDVPSDEFYEMLMSRGIDLGVNQEHLAKYLKTSQPTVSRLLASIGNGDDPKLDPDRMQRLCIALRIDASLVELVRVCQPDKAKSLHELIEEWNEIIKS